MALLDVTDSNPAQAIQELLSSLLNRGLVSAILAPQEIASKRTVVQTLVRDPNKLDAVNPLAPVFGVNSARIMAKMSNDLLRKRSDSSAEENSASVKNEEETPAPIAAVLRPCEIRAFVELVKLQQAAIDPFLIIGVDCLGTYSVTDYAAKVDQSSNDSSVTLDFLNRVTAGELPAELRGACMECQHQTPTYADLEIQLFGEDITKQLGLQPRTEKGSKMLNVLEIAETEENDNRETELAKMMEAKKGIAGQEEVDFQETISALCINCHNCQQVCPICYCKQCVFDGVVLEYTMEKYLNWSGKRGVLEMPPDKLLFHLTRMSHVATSCVACGQCEAACPNGIPLGRIYHKISTAAQKALGYEAGLSLDDELPFTTFREDELSVVES